MSENLLDGIFEKKIPVSQALEDLASMDVTTPERDIGDYQYDTSARLEDWIFLGERCGRQYGISGNAYFYDMPVDLDHEKYVPVPLKAGEVEYSPYTIQSLHRLVEVQTFPDPTTPISGSSGSTEERISLNPSTVQPAKETSSTVQCERVLSRFFIVGKLLLKRTKTEPLEATRFFVVKALGPPDCNGLWIIGDVPWTKGTQEEGADRIYTNLDGSEGPVSDEYLAQMRADRTAFLDGFPQPISYARIKDDPDRKVFDLVDPVQSNFVISSKVWLA